MEEGDGALLGPKSQFELDCEGLVFASSYTFAKVMADNPELAVRFAERVLGFEIGHLEFAGTEVTVSSALRKSVRLDAVLAGSGKVVEIEMQARGDDDLLRRVRQYRASIDGRISRRGADYAELPELYMIVVCLHDHFGVGRALYEFETTCKDDRSIVYDDGVHPVVLNATADMAGVPVGLANLLQYVKSNVPIEGDDLTMELAEATERAYSDEAWVGCVMTLDTERAHLTNKARKEGRVEGRAEGRAEGEGRITALVGAMRAAGMPDADIVAALAGPGLETLYERYGV